uniref:Putative secreted protein n=2 Tax=Anopheles triannulatus TaxID=58253 RepID=A0A2M4B0L6_9DIPT
MRVVIVLSSAVLLLLSTLSQLQLHCQAVENYDCGPLETYTATASCDFNCDDVCDVIIPGQCICNDGYLRNRKTGLCVPDEQCFPAIEPIKLSCLQD